MRLPRRQKHHSVINGHTRRLPERQTAALPGPANRRPKRLGRSRAQNKKRPVPRAIQPPPSDSARQAATQPHGDYSPLLGQMELSFEAAARPALSSPGLLYSANLRLLQPHSRNRLLIEAGSAVTSLMDLPNDDPSDSRRPGDRAHVRAHSMLVGLTSLNFSIPASDVYSDPDGAIRLLWARDDRSVELVFPSIEDESPYLYHSDANRYGVEEHPGPESALKWINWVFDNVLPEHVCAA